MNPMGLLIMILHTQFANLGCADRDEHEQLGGPFP